MFDVCQLKVQKIQCGMKHWQMENESMVVVLMVIKVRFQGYVLNLDHQEFGVRLLVLVMVLFFFSFLFWISLHQYIDINECLTNNGGCDTNAKCTNTDGSFTCTCNLGYSGDGFDCNGKKKKPFKTFSQEKK